MSFKGADPDQLRQLAALFSRSDSTLQTICADLERTIGHTHWRGPDRERLMGTWRDRDRPGLARASEILDDAAVLLRRQATEQERASSGAGGSALFSPGAVHHGPPGSDSGIPPVWTYEDGQRIIDAVKGGGWLYSGLSILGKVPSLPWLSPVVNSINVGYNWVTQGPGDARTWGAVVGSAGVPMALLGGPTGVLAGFAYSGAYGGTKAALHLTGADKALGDAGYSAAYGDRGNSDTLTPAQAAEITRRSQSWKVVPDVVGGGVRSAGRGARSVWHRVFH